MNYYHINVGHSYAKPYESEYNMLRRCFVVNPGMPMGQIINNIRRNALRDNKTSDILTTKQLHPEYIQSNNLVPVIGGFKKHCPKCAQELYHSEVFELPWMTHCPIHLCELTTHCPVCHEVWPNWNKITSRNCECCGRPPINKIKNISFSGASINEFSSIAYVYKIIHSTTSQNSAFITRHDSSTYKHDEWFEEVSITDEKFPSFQERINIGITKKRLLSLKLKNHKILCKSTILLPAPDNSEKDFLSPPESSTWGDEMIRYDFNSNKSRLKDQYTIMKYILSWIKTRTIKNHHTHLSTYRYLNMRYFIHAPDSCPYCMAISLWFFHSSAQQYGIETTKMVDDYNFCEESGIFHFYNGCIPLIHHNQNLYYASRNFDSWFYQRGLEISFVDIMRYVFAFRRFIKTPRKSKFIDPFYYQRCRLSDQHYSAKTENEHFYFYYENEHPLDVYHPEKTSYLGKVCSEFQEYHQNNKRDGNEVIFDDLPNTELTYKDFVSIRKRFDEYLTALWES